MSFYIKNKINQKLFNVERKIESCLERLICGHSLVFIVAQLSSAYVKKIVEHSYGKNIPVIFSVVGAIDSQRLLEAGQTDWLEKVSTYIHESDANAGRLNRLKNYRYFTIDHGAFYEQDLLRIPFAGGDMRRFLVLSRLSPEKGVEQIIKYFLDVRSAEDTLFIAGSGALEDELRCRYKENRAVKFLGFIKSSNVSGLLASIDCLIIPSPQEAGPNVGIEAMCAGKIIISTKVGAMPERLCKTLNRFWYEYDNFDSFRSAFREVKALHSSEAKKISISLRNAYVKEYSKSNTQEKYQKVVTSALTRREASTS